MASGVVTNELYTTSIQRALDYYRQAAPVLEKTLEDMDSAKGKWDRQSIDPTILEDTEENKKNHISDALLQYHTFVKTQELASKLFETLQAAYCHTTRPSIPEDVDETMAGLGLDVETFRQKRKALAVIAEHLSGLSNRALTIFKQKMEVRLPQIEKPLDRFISALRPGIAGYWAYNPLSKKPSLSAAYTMWLNDASEAEKNWAPSLQMPETDQVIFNSGNPALAPLDKALKTLGLTFIDPQGNRGYGKVPEERAPNVSCCDSPEKTTLTQSIGEEERKALALDELIGKEEKPIVDLANPFAEEPIFVA